MNSDNFYNILDEFYSIETGVNALKLNGTCPSCEKSSNSDLRFFCKKPENFENEITDWDDHLAYCQHCGTSSNAITIVKFNLGISYQKAKEILEDEDTFAKTIEIENKKSDEKPIPLCVSLKDSIEGVKYAHERNLTDRDISKYGILFSVGEIEYMGRKIYLKDRLFFPVYDRSGIFVGFQCRSIHSWSKAKYLLSPWMEKSDHLYGACYLPQEVKLLIICEGILDCIAWNRIPGIYAVASFGKSLSLKQLDILLDINPNKIYIAYDSDAIEKSFNFYEKYNHLFKEIKIVVMEDRDADEMEETELKRKIINAIDYDQDKKLLLMLEKTGKQLIKEGK